MSNTTRPILFSGSGMVVSGHHRASEAGAAVLRNGGNAMDAAVAASAALCVAIPHMNGLGGDCFALYYDAERGAVTCLNGSGAAPALASKREYALRGVQTMPERGPLSMSVCGLAHAWKTGLEHFGSHTRTLADLVAGAAGLAEEGGEIDLVLQEYFSSGAYAQRVARAPELEAVFGPHLKRPLGERLPQPALSRSLRALAGEGVETLYGGELGRALIADLSRRGALLTLDDLKRHRTTLGPAPSVPFHGQRLYFAPPNSQGIALGLLVRLWERLRTRESLSALSPEQYMRIKPLAFALRDRYAADPARGFPLPADLFDDDALDAALSTQSVQSARTRSPLRPAPCAGGDTTTLVVMDRRGNAVSWVQSLFADFGSGVVSPATGIVMHNRLSLERLDDDPLRGLRAGMRPFHTLCPALLVGDGRCELAIATPGDHAQPQTLFQVLLNVFEAHMDIQSAIEAPRMRHDDETGLMLETALFSRYARALPGVRIVDGGERTRRAGGVNAIQRAGGDVLMSGADPRRSCYAVCA